MADLIAMLMDPNSPEGVNQSEDVQDAARALGQKLVVLPASAPEANDLAFASLMQQRAGALLVTAVHPSSVSGLLHPHSTAEADRRMSSR